MVIPIAIVGDLPPDNRFHSMTTDSLHHAASALGISVEPQWIGTDKLAQENLTHANLQRQLTDFRGIWIAPGSPYTSMDGALAAIRFARESRVPLLGTCGGFQHIILEYARNILGFADASHAETDPYASALFISRLACSLVGRTMAISLAPDSLLARAYGKTPVQEGYYCNFGVNPDYMDVLRSGKLRVVASDEEGEVRAVELTDHPFFVGTLFIPQLKSTADNPHPIVIAFLQAAVSTK